MSASSANPGSMRDRDVATGSQRADHTRRQSTETEAAFKTTEFIAYLVVLAGILIAGLIITGGADDEFQANRVWLYATILTGAYMISRGLAKAGSREPYDAGRSCGRSPRSYSGASPRPGGSSRMKISMTWGGSRMTWLW